jgi:PAS domain S-box-containing protein
MNQWSGIFDSTLVGGLSVWAGLLGYWLLNRVWPVRVRVTYDSLLSDPDNTASERRLAAWAIQAQGAAGFFELPLSAQSNQFRGDNPPSLSAAQLGAHVWEHALEGMYLCSPQGELLQANTAFARLCGYDSPSELLAGFREFTRNWYREESRGAALWEQLQKQGRVGDAVSTVHTKTGESLVVCESLHLLRNSANGCAGYFSIVRTKPLQPESRSRLRR